MVQPQTFTGVFDADDVGPQSVLVDRPELSVQVISILLVWPRRPHKGIFPIVGSP